jgi:YVTN family beta-propeller protein
VSAANPRASWVYSAAWFAYAPWDTSFYVASPPSSVDVVNPGNYTVTSVIPVGSSPFAVAVDAAAKEVFVTNAGSGNVTVISGTTQAVIGSVTVQKSPLGIAYDSANRTLFVADNGTSNVSVISVGSLSVVATVHVGLNPTGVAWDNATNRTFVTDHGSSQVSIISAASNRVVSTVPVGKGPYGVAVDNASGNVYVANEGSNNVSAFSARTGVLNATVPVLLEAIIDLQGIAYDPLHNVVWVAAGTTAVVINTSIERVVDEVWYDPSGVAFDPSNGDICVSNLQNRTFECYVFGSLVPQGTVTFSENGLSTGTVWNVTMGLPYYAKSNVTQASSTSRIVFGVDQGTWSPWWYNYSYWIASVGRHLPFPSRGYVASWTGAGGNSLVNVTFLASNQYLVTFNETGLASGTNWSVTLGGSTRSSTTASITFVETNGSYSYSVPNVAGWQTSQRSGTVVVSGGPVGVTIPWTAAPTYAVTFTETGLPGGTLWNVTIWNVTLQVPHIGRSGGASSITFLEPNGTYGYAVAPLLNWATNRSNGTLMVAGAPVGLSIPWSPSPSNGDYPVTFTEVGLPYGDRWNAVITGSQISESGSEFAPTGFTFSVPNGTYTYSVTGPSGWYTAEAAGNLTVSGAAVTVSVQWIQVGTYPVTFTETGLPSGWMWQVTLDTYAQAVTSSTIVFAEPNGTYTYTIPRMQDWGTARYNGTVVVAGAPVDITVAWVSIFTYPVLFTETGLPNGTLWNVSLPGSVTPILNQSSRTPSITFAEPNGTYAFSIYGFTQNWVNAYVATPSSGNVTVRGAAASVRVTFTLSPSFYLVTFVETGLPVGLTWSLALDGQGLSSTTSSIVAAEPNGTYPYTVGGTIAYTPSPSSGTLTVQGGPVQVSVTFTISPGYYAITFVETGLAPGTSWEVGLAEWTASVVSTGSRIVFEADNGTYSFDVRTLAGYADSPDSGYVTVAGSAPAPVVITFTSTNLYRVTFQETGLPTGTGWAVSIGSQLESSLARNLTLMEPNGTFGYVVLPVSGYTTVSSGLVTVNATNVTVPVSFSPQTFPVIIVEFGLPNGTTWTVTISNATTGVNVTRSTNGSALIFYLPNGTYSIHVYAGGFLADLSTATFTVAGAALGGGPTVRFIPAVVPTNPSRGPAGPTWLLFGVGLGGAALAVALAAWLVARRLDRAEATGRTRPPTGEPSSAPERERR